MFCSECGSPLPEDARFCQECGAKIPIPDKEKTFGGSADSQMRSVQADMPSKKKPKKPAILIGVAAVFLAIAAVFIALNWNGKIDYVATVAKHTPFAVSQGLPYTYEEVLNKYLVDAKWEVRDEGDIHYVDITGKVNGIESELEIVVKVSPNPDDSDAILIRPESISADGVDRISGGDAVDFLYTMFYLYDAGYKDLSVLLEEDPFGDETGHVSDMDSYTVNPAPLEQPEEDPFGYETDYREEYSRIVRELSAENDNLQFALIDLLGDGVPQLVVEDYGYSVSVFHSTLEEVVTLMDQWGYGAMGNAGYEYLPGQNVIRNYNSDYAGGVIYETYMKVDDSYEAVEAFYLTVCYIDENMEELDEPLYYYNEEEISEEEYNSYQNSGDYKPIVGNLSADEMLDLLKADYEVIEDYVTASGVPIEDYYRLSGLYSDSAGYTNLSLGIYSSQEEGETAIGTAVLYIDGEERYLGEVIPNGKGVYKIEASTGDEIILKEHENDSSVLQLYENGEYRDDYSMIEHYES